METMIDDSKHTTTGGTTTAGRSTNGNNARKIAKQKKLWISHQTEIAAAVVAIDDNVLPGSEPFHWIDLHHDKAPTTRLVGGTDVSFAINSPDNLAVAVYTVLRDDSTVVYSAHKFFQVQQPYIPSFLAFREIDPLCELIVEQRQKEPDLTPEVILVDGNGIWHERSAGLASALGVRLNIPTIGVGKTFYNAGGWHKGLLERLTTHTLHQAVETLVAGPVEQSHRSALDGFFMVWKRDAVSSTVAQSLEPCPHRKSELLELLLSKTGACGVAIPLVSQSNSNMKCCILIGHGGRRGGRYDAPTTNPIFISIGHKVSLRQAVELVCSLSLVRIPRTHPTGGFERTTALVWNKTKKTT